jgi:hypothetical protein
MVKWKYGRTVPPPFTNNKTAKRGPKFKLERQFEGVRRLPKREQEFVSKFLDNVLSNSMSG